MPLQVLPAVVNLLSLANPIKNVIKEKHYVKRSTAIYNGLGLIATGISIIAFPHSNLLLLLAAIALLQGFLGIGLTTTRENLGTKICSSPAVLLTLIVVFAVQLFI